MPVSAACEKCGRNDLALHRENNRSICMACWSEENSPPAPVEQKKK